MSTTDAIIITTASGSRYHFEADEFGGGYVTRMSERPVDGLGDRVIVRAACDVDRMPVVGRPWTFRLVEGPVMTTPVVEVRPG